VFFNPSTGTKYVDINAGFRAALRRAKIKDFHFQDLRHTFASHSVMQGVDIKTVSELLGHSTLQMTRRYTHLSPGHKQKAITLLSQAYDQHGINGMRDSSLSMDK
jgi:integrase